MAVTFRPGCAENSCMGAVSETRAGSAARLIETPGIAT
jgi:hypothetical protein